MTEHVAGLIWDAWRTRRNGADAIVERQRARLADMVAHARAHSPYYRELYQGLPERVADPTLLPVTDKKKLMARFDVLSKAAANHRNRVAAESSGRSFRSPVPARESVSESRRLCSQPWSRMPPVPQSRFVIRNVSVS